jgi:hypothetical protein
MGSPGILRKIGDRLKGFIKKIPSVIKKVAPVVKKGVDFIAQHGDSISSVVPGIKPVVQTDGKIQPIITGFT